MVTFVRLIRNPPLSSALASHIGGKCPYCKQVFVRDPLHPHAPSRGHVRPKWDGWTLRIICCRRCNSDKGGMFLSQWLDQLRLDNDPRIEFVEKVAAAHPFMARPTGRTHPQAPQPDDGRRTDAQAMLEGLRGRGEAPAIDDKKRTKKEIAFAMATRNRTAPWVRCVACGPGKPQFFPSEKALAQHFEAVHGTAKPKAP